MQVLYGMLLGIMAQILTFLQLQGNVKYDWFRKYPIPMLLVAIPISYLFIKSVEFLVEGFNGEIWPSRLIGFGIGAIVFTFMSSLMFNEHISTKTGVCLLLSVAIILIQIFWK